MSKPPRKSQLRLVKSASVPNLRVSIPTTDDRRDVTIFISTGWTLDEIASHFGISVPTLRSLFADEIRKGPGEKWIKSMILLDAQAENMNNVPALKASIELQKEGRAVRSGQTAAAKLGKKEKAQAAAQTAGHGTEWGDDLLPTTH